MTCYFLRNIQKDPEGRHVGWWDGYKASFPDSHSVNGIFYPGHALEVVDRVENFSSQDDEVVAEWMFARYNRGSGQDCEFKGNSMSKGDVVIMYDKCYSLRAFSVESFGFNPIDHEPRFVDLIDEFNKKFVVSTTSER